MALYDGDPALPDDVWLRLITDSRYLTKQGRLHNRAFTGKAISAPNTKRPWDHELSGRLLTLAADVDGEARQFCNANSREYAGVMYQEVRTLRGIIEEEIETDVVYTPRDDDKAHADLTFLNTNADNLQDVRDRLQEVMQTRKPEDVPAFQAAFRVVCPFSVIAASNSPPLKPDQDESD